MDVGRRGLRLARQAVHELGRDGDCAVAFSLNGDVDSDEAAETIRLLARLFADEAEPPDLVLLETLSLLTPTLDAAIEGLLATGLPVWLSFRRCRHGLCGIYGQHWGGPEGDAFGRAARRFEEMGVAALLINCIPPDHVAGMVSYLRDFTDLPLGVYPNLGYYSDRGWRFTPGVGGEEYAEMALRWRAEGAQIVGGCCGVRPEHIAAAAQQPAGHGARPRATDRRRPPWPQRRRGRRARGAAAAVDRPPPAPALPAAVPRPQRRAGRGAPERRQLHGLALRLRRGHRRAPALPGHRLRHGHPRRPARPQRRGPRARARHRRPRGGQHAGQRLPQRRRRPRHRGDRRPLPVGARGALRGHRREPLPEAHRSVRARVEPPAARLLGAQPRSTS